MAKEGTGWIQGSPSAGRMAAGQVRASTRRLLRPQREYLCRRMGGTWPCDPAAASGVMVLLAASRLAGSVGPASRRTPILRATTRPVVSLSSARRRGTEIARETQRVDSSTERD